MVGEYQLVDALLGLAPPPGSASDENSNIRRWFHQSKPLNEGATVEDTLADMDAAGVEKGILFAGFDRTGDGSWKSQLEKVATAVEQSKGRLFGFSTFDPKEGMEAVRKLEESVREYGFVACHIVPSSVGLPANDAMYYPMYAKCIELDIPVRVNCGFPGFMAPAKLQQPIFLDEICLTFPELTIVGSHVGHPWHLETVALLQKHPNFRLMTAGFSPKYVPAEIWHVANTRASHKLMWASDYPLLTIERAAEEGWELPLRDEAKRGYLRDNALETFRLG